MFALFDTLEKYNAKNSEINAALGYPDGNGTERYAADNPRQDVNGKYSMQILPHVAHLFAGCTIVETVEYPQEAENEID